MRISANLWTQLHTLTLLHLHAEEEGIGLFTIPHLRRNGELDVLIVRRGSIHLYIIRTESSNAPAPPTTTVISNTIVFFIRLVISFII